MVNDRAVSLRSIWRMRLEMFPCRCTTGESTLRCGVRTSTSARDQEVSLGSTYTRSIRIDQGQFSIDETRGSSLISRLYDRLAGWWGHESSTRFAMPPKFVPSPGAAGFQLSNPSVLDVISLYASLELFKAAGEFSTPKRLASPQTTSTSTILGALRKKSIDLTTYLEFLLVDNPRYLPLDKFADAPQDSVHFTIITPLDPERRGAQLSILFSPADKMQVVFERLMEQGVLADERKPGVIRLSPVPLYNSFADVLRCATALTNALER